MDAKSGTDSPPLFIFPHLDKLVVRAGAVGGPVRLLEGLEIIQPLSIIACPLLSTLDISRRLEVKDLARTLRGRSSRGCKLPRLRLGNAYGLAEDIERLQVRDYVDELERFDVGAEPRDVQLPDFVRQTWGIVATLDASGL